VSGGKERGLARAEIETGGGKKRGSRRRHDGDLEFGRGGKRDDDGKGGSLIPEGKGLRARREVTRNIFLFRKPRHKRRKGYIRYRIRGRIDDLLGRTCFS